MIESFLNDRVKIKVGDITKEGVDAIVNAANSTLLGGGGVDGAIHDDGGPRILEECREIRRTRFPDGLPTGQAVITSAGDLAARYVIHTVGPIYDPSRPDCGQLLSDCYTNSLVLAAAYSLTSIAFPSISTGAYGYPKPDAAEVASEAIARFLSSETSILEVRLVFFSIADAQTFLKHHHFAMSVI